MEAGMLNRRGFLHHLGAALAVGALDWPWGLLLGQPAPAGGDARADRRLALLADAHVSLTPRGLAAAANLRAAVAAINAHYPPVDLVCFLGDLSEASDPAGFRLGWEILSTLNAPLWCLWGETGPPAPSLAVSPLSRPLGGAHLIAFDHCQPEAPDGPRFCLRPPLLHWLQGQLAAVPARRPLLILSHAPLYPLFPPWDWYTAGAAPLLAALRQRGQVLLLHGHVHQYLTTVMDNLTFQGVRATSWPLPDVRVGTTSACPTPGALPSPLGCGWLLVTVFSSGAVTLTDQPLTV
jgi:Icc protein